MSSESIEVESNDPIIRPNSVWLHGVDNLSTKDIKQYVKKYTNEDFKIEWINDESLNVVFEQDSNATELLNGISIETKESPEDERPAQLIDETKPDSVFLTRISNTNDKKVKNAALYSRYYLFNPKENEKRERKRKHHNRHDDDTENEYRERETIRRRNRDDDDLFPEKSQDLSTSVEIDDKDEDLIGDDSNKSGDLLSRIGSTDDSKTEKSEKSLLERLG